MFETRLMKIHGLSKENIHSFPHLLWSAAALLLLRFPDGLPVWQTDPAPWLLQVALPGAVLVWAVCNLLRHLGPVGWPWRLLPLLPLAVPATAMLGPIPHPLYALLTVAPWCALWLAIAPHWLPRRPWTHHALALLFTFLLALQPTDLLTRAGIESLPRLVHNQFMYVWAALLIPVGLASRPFLRPFARKLLKTELYLLLIPFLLLPLLWLGATSLKENGETVRNPDRFAPLPRLRVNTEFDWADRLPDAWFVYPDTLDLLRAWNETSLLLSERALLAAFAGSDIPLPPDRMLQAFRINDFLQRDPHGYFVPESAFTRDVPPQMDPDAHIWIERLRRHATMTPRKLAGRLHLDSRQALLLLRRLQELDLARRVPGREDRFRPTADARKPLEGGWHPRMLLIAATPPENARLSRADYGQAWGLSISQTKEELRHMRENGLLEPLEGFHPDLHRRLLTDFSLGRRVALHLFALCAALLIGKYLPVALPPWSRAAPTLLALLLLAPWKVDPLLDVPVRIAAGCWLFRHALPDRELWNHRICLFGALCGWIQLMPQMLPPQVPLETRAAWTTLWLPPALILLAFLLRPLPRKKPQPASPPRPQSS